MNKVSDEFVADVVAALQRHGIKDIQVASAVGQALDRVPGRCPGVDVQWCMDGQLYSYVVRSGAIDIIKTVVERLGGASLNYNDMDTDMWAARVAPTHTCLECDNGLNRLMGRPEQDPATCPRCKGSQIDPEFHADAWVLVFDDHGNALAFVVYETISDVTLHIRELPYNQGNRRKAVLKRLTADVLRGEHKLEDELLRNGDSRDTGFVLSLSVAKAGGHYDGHTSIKAVYAIDTVVQHFPCVLESELKEKLEDTADGKKEA